MGLGLLVHDMGMLMLWMDVVSFDLRLHKVHFSLRLEIFVECDHIDRKSLKPFLALGGVEEGGIHLRARLG